MNRRVLLVGAAPHLGDPASLTALAAAVDCVIAVDGGGRLCLAAGVRPDVVVGDMDSLGGDELAALRDGGAVVEQHERAKDYSDLALGIAAARGRGAEKLVVVGVTGGRLDHSLAAIGELAAAADLAPELCEPSLSGWIMGTEGRHELTLEGSGAPFSVLALLGPARYAVSGGVWSSPSIDIPALGSRGLSNAIADTSATVRVLGGVVLVSSERDVAGRIAALVG